MSTTLTAGPVSIAVPWNYQETAYPANIADVQTQNYAGAQLSNGSGANQANIKYANQITLAASGTTTLDLATLTDNFGNALNFVRIKGIYIENSSAKTSSSIAVGNAGTTPFSAIWSPGTAVIEIRNGTAFWVGIAADATAYAVSTGVNILITNNDSANQALVNVVIIGCNA